jgi:hypothetical protein
MITQPYHLDCQTQNPRSREFCFWHPSRRSVYFLLFHRRRSDRRRRRRQSPTKTCLTIFPVFFVFACYYRSIGTLMIMGGLITSGKNCGAVGTRNKKCAKKRQWTSKKKITDCECRLFVMETAQRRKKIILETARRRKKNRDERANSSFLP